MKLKVVEADLTRCNVFFEATLLGWKYMNQKSVWTNHTTILTTYIAVGHSSQRVRVIKFSLFFKSAKETQQIELKSFTCSIHWYWMSVLQQ